MSAPPRTLSFAEAGASGVPESSECWIQCHVPGRICMIPRAPAVETRLLLKPLSCQAIASVSEYELPFATPIEPIWEPDSRSRVGYGGALTLPMAAVPWGSKDDDDVLVEVKTLRLGVAAGVPDRWIAAPAGRMPLSDK